MFFLFFNDPATTEIYTLSLHDALPILCQRQSKNERLGDALDPIRIKGPVVGSNGMKAGVAQRNLRCARSEEHTSELQSPYDLVCRLLLEKKKITQRSTSEACAYAADPV